MKLYIVFSKGPIAWKFKPVWNFHDVAVLGLFLTILHKWDMFFFVLHYQVFSLGLKLPPAPSHWAEISQTMLTQIRVSSSGWKMFSFYILIKHWFACLKFFQSYLKKKNLKLFRIYHARSVHEFIEFIAANQKRITKNDLFHWGLSRILHTKEKCVAGIFNKLWGTDYKISFRWLIFS